MRISKTKLGGALLALSIVLPAIADAVQTGDWLSVLKPATEALGVVTTAFGLRNALGALKMAP